MNDPRHYQETHDFCQETKKKSKSRNLLQQRLDETIEKSIKEEKQRKIPSPFFLKEESLTDQEASLEETEKDSKFVCKHIRYLYIFYCLCIISRRCYCNCISELLCLRIKFGNFLCNIQICFIFFQFWIKMNGLRYWSKNNGFLPFTTKFLIR